MTSHDLDLSSRRRIHVVGVGGPGMSAIAIVLAQMGHDVSGSDVREVATLESVRGSGVRV
ncbi:MAG: Mur ligase domain-containing protein, partial [Ilumatobacteraceae bacterium]